MPVTLRTLQLAAMVAVFGLLYVARASRGRPRQTPAGLAFPLKPLVLLSRAVALPLYFLLFAYPLWISRASIPLWLLVLLFAALLFGLYQLPGTIVLGPEAVTQRFWLRNSKHIPYTAIAGVQASTATAITRVLGPGGSAITHTANHAASAAFRTELEALRSTARDRR